MHVLKKFPDPDGVSDHSQNPIISNSLLSYVVKCHRQIGRQTNHPQLVGDNNIFIWEFLSWDFKKISPIEYCHLPSNSSTWTQHYSPSDVFYSQNYHTVTLLEMPKNQHCPLQAEIGTTQNQCVKNMKWTPTNHWTIPSTICLFRWRYGTFETIQCEWTHSSTLLLFLIYLVRVMFKKYAYEPMLFYCVEISLL